MEGKQFLGNTWPRHLWRTISSPNSSLELPAAGRPSPSVSSRQFPRQSSKSFCVSPLHVQKAWRVERQSSDAFLYQDGPDIIIGKKSHKYQVTIFFFLVSCFQHGLLEAFGLRAFIHSSTSRSGQHPQKRCRPLISHKPWSFHCCCMLSWFPFFFWQLGRIWSASFSTETST